MTTLYRLYNNAGELLYIGIAEHWPSRMKQHAREKAWWDDVAATKFEKHDTREAAEEAERFAIKAERPLHNVVHAGKKAQGHHSIPATLPDQLASLPVGTVVALGLASGQCPVGSVMEVDGSGLWLDLYSWFTGHFGYETRRVSLKDIVRVRKAHPLPKSHNAKHGSGRDITVYDMDPLAEFQTEWTRR